MSTRQRRKCLTSIRKHSATTTNRWAVSACVFLASALLLSACDRPTITRATPQPESSPTLVVTATPDLLTITPTTGMDVAPYTIERITLATRVDDDGEPTQEVSTVPEAARQFYLCVQAKGLPTGTRFRAYWLESGQVIGQSDKVALATAGESTWVSLAYYPPFPLNPAAEHAVELLIDDVKVERYAFRVGDGNPADAIAVAAFANRFDAAGEPLGVKTRFPVDTPSLTLRVRISRMVDPTGMMLATLWFRGQTQVAEVPTDPQPDSDTTPTTPSREFAFTWTPVSALVPGDYRVEILMNGTDAGTVAFTVFDPGSSADTNSQAEGTPSPESRATVRSVVIAESVKEGSNEPIGSRVRDLEAQPDASVQLWVAVRVRNVTPADTVAILVNREGTLFASDTLPTTSRADGWLALPVRFQAPSLGGDAVNFEVIVMLNGARANSTSFTISPEEE